MPNLGHHGHLEPTAQEADLLRHLRGIRFGQLLIQVHDARIVQIERTDRIRTDARISEAVRTG